MFFKIGVLQSFAIRPATLFKTDSNTSVFLHYLRLKNTFFYITSFLTEHFRWLLLKIMNSSSYLRVLPIVATKYFAVCKHCSGTLFLVEDVTSSHGFGN